MYASNSGLYRIVGLRVPCIKRCCKLLPGFEPGLEATDDLRLMLGTGEDVHSAGSHRNGGLL